MITTDENVESIETFILQTRKLGPRMEKFLWKLIVQLGLRTRSPDSWDRVIAIVQC